MKTLTTNLLWPRFGFIGVACVFFTGCASIHLPKNCCRPIRPVETKKTLLASDGQFARIPLEGGGRNWTVFVPRNGLSDRHRPPILLLHEMSALSPGTLKLALHLSDEYTVYVPLLFGGEFDDNNSQLLGIQRLIGMGFFRPAWNAQGTGERQITRELAGLSRTILSRHDQNAKLAVIGMCITGIIPLQIAGQQDPIPRLRGVVLSQPTMPMLALTRAQRNSLGISNAELERAKKWVKKANVRILGFRFEKDPISPPERFTRLNKEFGTKHFEDGTLKASEYGEKQVQAHAVLTDGYCDPETNEQKCAGAHAYQQLREYLNVALAK